MNVQWWKLVDGGTAVSSDDEAAVAAFKGRTGAFWADVSDYEPEELDGWLQRLDLDEAVRRCCLASGHMPRMMPLDGAVFFEFPVHRAGAESDLIELGFLCMENLVVTIHGRSVSSLEAVAHALLSEPAFRPGSTSALVAGILLILANESTRIAGLLKVEVYALDERMDRGPEDVDAEAILEAKRWVRNLDIAVDEQKSMFGLIGLLNRPFLDARGSAEAFEAMGRSVSVAERAVDRMEKHVADLQLHYNANRQEKTNQRLAVLTVISAIFLPLTLIAGIYGMNFDAMPELHLPYAYPAALGAMVVTALGLYWYFRVNGWLD